ncbi:MAG: carboxypeptidase-like regulatory domain-containing protein, partial [Pseudomonadota bacterium]
MEINIQKMKQLISLKNSAKIWLPAMLAIVFSVGITFAQNSGVVNGVVVDESGKRLPNASVVVKGTQQSVTSDSKGSFSIQAAMGKTLVVSYVGYATKEVLVSGNSLSVVLKEEVTTLEEVVSIGYSKLRKSDLTGAISSVKARELNLST